MKRPAFPAILAMLALVAAVAPALADDYATCDKGAGDASIAACSRLLERHPRDATAYNNRGAAYYRKGEYDSAIADLNEAIRLNQKYFQAYNNRGAAYVGKGDYDRAIADFSETIRLDPKHPPAYNNRGAAYNGKRDYDHAIADFDEAIRLDPRSADAYNNRGLAYAYKGEYDRAIADEDRALRLRPDYAHAHGIRGYAYARKGDLDRGMADINKALSLDAGYAAGYAYRAAVYELRGDLDRAMADADRAIQLDPRSSLAYSVRGKVFFDRKEYARAIAADDEALKLNPVLTEARQNRERAEAALVALSRLPAPADNTRPATSTATTVATAPAGRRVALVIGNSRYANVPFLPNPQHDAQAVAGALRADGFQTVMLVDDAGRDAMREALRTFRAAADKADWALVYYAGHGIQIGRVNWLIPVDARLADERDVQGEAIAYSEVEASVAGARALRLVILDACRVDPFLGQMARLNPSRAVPRGLSAPPEPEPGMLVVYSAKDGQTAEDGDGALSPFARAFVAQIKVPGREVRRLFDFVRDDVLRATGRRQQPFTYGSLPSDQDFFFVAGK